MSTSAQIYTQGVTNSQTKAGCDVESKLQNKERELVSNPIDAVRI
jgi:hypothetical protein